MPQLSLKLSSTNLKILTLYKQSLLSKFIINKAIYLPNTKKKITIIKAPHIHKKSRDQYEITTYNQILIFNPMTVLLLKKFQYLLTKTVPANLKLQLRFIQKHSSKLV